MINKWYEYKEWTYSGFFLVLEGIDGSGKSTIAEIIKRNIEKLGIRTYITREPTESPTGQILKKYMDIVHYSLRNPIYEALLFATDRIYHLTHLIIPLLKKGYLVICDRYVYSSLAYQSINGVDETWIGIINKYILKPDLAIFLDVKPNIAIKRLKKSRNIFEFYDFLIKVYNNYIKLVNKGELERVDGTKEPNSIAEEIIKNILNKWKKINN